MLQAFVWTLPTPGQLGLNTPAYHEAATNPPFLQCPILNPHAKRQPGDKQYAQRRPQSRQPILASSSTKRSSFS